MPRLTYYFSTGDWDEINALLERALSVMVTIGFPCVAGCVVLSSEIIEFVAGQQYSSASIPLVILMVAFLVDIFGGSFLGNMVCLPARQEKVFMEACWFAAIVNVVLNYILIPYGGASAAAFTSGISSLIIFVWLLTKKDKRIELKGVTRIIKSPLLGSLIIILFCTIIKKVVSNLFVKVIVCVGGSVLLYCITLLLFRNELCIEVCAELKRIVKKSSSPKR